MGMTIDNAITWLNTDDYESKGFADATSVAIDTMRKYQQLKADYENRLKADLVAMLTELQLEIEEMSGLVTEIHGEEWNEVNVIHSQDVLSFIQQKINSLEEA